MNLRIQCFHDLETAEKLWNLLTPRKTIHDMWDVRYSLYKPHGYDLFFYTAFDDEEVVGLLPLQWNSSTQCLEFFGAGYTENNQIFVKSGYQSCREILYRSIDKTAHLEYIVGDDDFTQQLSVLEQQYYLPLERLNSLEDYLTTYFTSESRGKMRRKMRHIEKEKVEITKNNISDIEQLFQFNISNFNDRSTFNFKGRKEAIRTLLTLPYSIYLLRFDVNGQPWGVSLSIEYGGVYEYINLGVHPEAHKDMRAYIHLKNIETAILSGAKEFDAGCADCGWKELFHLDKRPQREFVITR